MVPVKKKKNPRRFPSFSCPRSRFLNLLPSDVDGSTGPWEKDKLLMMLQV